MLNEIILTERECQRFVKAGSTVSKVLFALASGFILWLKWDYLSRKCGRVERESILWGYINSHSCRPFCMWRSYWTCLEKWSVKSVCPRLRLHQTDTFLPPLFVLCFQLRQTLKMSWCDPTKSLRGISRVYCWVMKQARKKAKKLPIKIKL